MFAVKHFKVQIKLRNKRKLCFLISLYIKFDHYFLLSLCEALKSNIEPQIVAVCQVWRLIEFGSELKCPYQGISFLIVLWAVGKCGAISEFDCVTHWKRCDDAAN